MTYDIFDNIQQDSTVIWNIKWGPALTGRLPFDIPYPRRENNSFKIGLNWAKIDPCFAILCHMILEWPFIAVLSP